MHRSQWRDHKKNRTQGGSGFSGNIIEAEAGLTECGVGDRVLVHAGCIIQRLTDTEAAELDEIMQLIGGL